MTVLIAVHRLVAPNGDKGWLRVVWVVLWGRKERGKREEKEGEERGERREGK